MDADALRYSGTTGDAGSEAFRVIANRSHDGFLVLDDRGVILWASDMAARFFASTPERLAGQLFGQPREVAAPSPDIEIVTPDGGYGTGDLSMSPLTWQGSAGTLLTIRDISLSTLASQRLAFASDHDTVTGLLGRKAFNQRLRQARERALRFGGGFSVIMVVPDQIPAVNASLGYDLGEELVIQTALRLSQCLDSADALGRIDHQAFAFVIEDVASMEQAVAKAQRVAEAFQTPLHIGDRDLSTTVSIGVVHADGTEGPDADLLQAAHAAAQQGSSRSRTTVGTYSDTSADTLLRQFEFEEELRTAVSRDQLVLAYQPIVTTAGHQLVAVEALVRWRRTPRETLLPGRFMATAEAIGVSAEIDLWVLREACAQAARWNQDRPLTMHVNISGHDLVEPSFVAAAVDVVRAAQVDPSRICFELTETALIDAGAMADLGALRAAGCRFAIDDFGTGFSSYTLLNQLSLDVLKIDRSFVSGLGRSYKDGLIVNSMITLARGLDLACIAEGVETPAQQNLLAALDCELTQGFLVAKPMHADLLTERMATTWSARARGE